MDIILKSNSGAYILTEEDRVTLMASSLITPAYKGGGNAAIYDLSALDSSAKVYTPEDITVKKTELQAIINDAQSKLDEIVAIEVQATPMDADVIGGGK